MTKITSILTKIQSRSAADRAAAHAGEADAMRAVSELRSVGLWPPSNRPPAA
jgi:hypothetical protein